VLINEDGDRVNSYHIWNYAEGNDSYYSTMLVDLTQPPDKVSYLLSDNWSFRMLLSRFDTLRSIPIFKLSF